MDAAARATGPLNAAGFLAASNVDQPIQRGGDGGIPDWRVWGMVESGSRTFRP
jgi:hypothetical protein